MKRTIARLCHTIASQVADLGERASKLDAGALDTIAAARMVMLLSGAQRRLNRAFAALDAAETGAGQRTESTPLFDGHRNTPKIDSTGS